MTDKTLQEKFDDIAFDLSPVGKHDFVTQREAVKILNGKEIPISLRTFQLYLKKALLRKGFREGKEVYYHKRYIILELEAIHFLKTTFNLSIDEIQELARYKKAYLYKIVEQLHKVLMFVFDHDHSPKKTGRLFAEIMNNRTYQTVADAYFKLIRSGQEYIVEDVKKFVDSALNQK
ncbi:MAG: hypothetical protein ABSB18_03780 [Candidatus Omnitrophota bacterium]|jgi:hypothetical protein